MNFFNDIGNAFKSVGASFNTAVIQPVGNAVNNKQFLLDALQGVGDKTLSGLTTAGDATLSGLTTAGDATLSGLKTAGNFTLQNLMGSKRQPQQLVEGTQYTEEQPTDYSGLLIMGVVGVVVWRILR